ncbi:MAG TPA: enoyl-CoA hydratase [Acidimicrobiales bacterium]|nr:enoyl-CoA hydratase [Acidimicrobiales bacterium]
MPDPRPEAIIVEQEGGVVTVTLDRPERKNAINDRMLAELLDLFGRLPDDPTARVVVITGAGGAFCSGWDLGDKGEVDDANSASRMRRLHRLPTALHELPQPTIARIGGVAAGAGLNLALGCDLTLASSEARFSQIFARRGLATDYGGAWLLPRLIGLHRAKEMAFFGEVLDAAEAERLGLVNRVVPPGELDALVADWAGRLAAGPPIALAQIKRMMDRAFETSFAAQLDAESTAQALLFTTADTAEAMGAFFEKRAPDFQGR